MKVGKLTAAIVAVSLGGVILTTAISTTTVTQTASATTTITSNGTSGTDSGMPYD
jgi:hypothetical protein